MKLGIISDLHIDRNEAVLKENETFENILAEIATKEELDYLMIAGDISNHYEESHRFIKKVEELTGVSILFVPGNHDYWAKDHELENTNEVDAFFKEQSYSLVGEPKILNKEWAIVGTPGWYDYGYGNHEVYSVADFEKKRYKFASWNDLHYVDWQQSDQEVSSDMLEQVREDLNQVNNRKVILMTHVATHPEFIVPLPHRVYDYANAFLGAKAYEGLYQEFPGIQYSVMGHVHFRKTFEEKGTTYLCACLGNKKHWRTKDVKKQIERTLLIIEL